MEGRRPPLLLRVLSSLPLLLLAPALWACGSGLGTLEGAAGGRDLFGIAKSDGTGYSPCEVSSTLAFVNDPATTETVLAEVGVSSRARRGILSHRDGPDGVFGTRDDDPFDDLEELDAVPYVGPKTIELLATHAGGHCAGEGSCRVDATLSFLNDPTTTVEVLAELGVYAPARTRLIAHRDGPDGLFGTGDDDPYDSLAEVDAVPYVGPATLDLLVRHASAACGLAAPGTVEVVFSPKPWGQSHLAKVTQWIGEAESHIDVAMYSLRDGTVIQALEAAAARGVSIRLLYEKASEDRKDPAGTLSARLEDAGIEVRWINKIMHHKFAIFDGPRADLSAAGTARVVSGSGNWSYSAGTRYDENTLFIEGNPEITLRLQDEFELLWNHSRPVVWNESIPSLFTDVVDDAAIAAVDTQASHAYFTSANFRTYESSRYGPTFSRVRGRNEIADQIVAEIASATQSIWIASGHLRSRPIAEALLAAHQAKPNLDIRILLDNQEFISEGYHNYQQYKLQRCLDDARSEAEIEDCYDTGFLFSFALHQAGVPVRFKAYAYRWHYRYAVQMHHKYILIDGRKVLTGSYNLSDNAEHNTMENLLVFDGAAYPQLVQDFVDNFEALWELGRAEGRYEAFLAEISDGVGPVPIVFEPMTLTYEEFDALKAAIRAACPAVDSDDYKDDPENHTTCYP